MNEPNKLPEFKELPQKLMKAVKDYNCHIDALAVMRTKIDELESLDPSSLDGATTVKTQQDLHVLRIDDERAYEALMWECLAICGPVMEFARKMSSKINDDQKAQWEAVKDGCVQLGFRKCWEVNYILEHHMKKFFSYENSERHDYWKKIRMKVTACSLNSRKALHILGYKDSVINERIG